MVRKESIGKVVGDDGKTYRPSVTQEGNGSKVRFTFERTPNKNTEETITSSDIILPYFHPKSTPDGLLFSVTTDVSSDIAESLLIPWDQIRGKQGPSGKLDVKIIDDIDTLRKELNETEIVVIDGAEMTQYVHSDDTIYLDVSKKDETREGYKDKIDAWVIYTDANDNRSLEKINSVIDLTEYYTITEVDTKVQNDISSAISGALEQQQAIYNTLTNGIEINTTEYTSNANVINIISDVTVEGLREEIIEMLKKYIKTEALKFDYDDGTLYVSEDD